MLLAEETATEASSFAGFDIFMILFTVLLVIAFFRSISTKEKNKFAIVFITISLVVFLFLDVVMVLGWLNIL